jgi:eukaryotic-like serine/threonine-protein kinase
MPGEKSMKSQFWKSDAFFGVVIVGVFLVLVAALNPILSRLELAAYDWGVRGSSKQPSDKIAVIAIDDTSIANIGRWPWSRDIIAKQIDKLVQAKPKAIGYSVFLSEPQRDAGLRYIDRIGELHAKGFPDPAAVGLPPEAREIGVVVKEAQAALNTDAILAESMKRASNVVLPYVFDNATRLPPAGKPDKATPKFLADAAVKKVTLGDGLAPWYGDRLSAVPIEPLAAVAAGFGHLVPVSDDDSVVRTEPALIQFDGQMYPSMGVVMAAKALNASSADISAAPGQIKIAQLTVPISEFGLVRTHFYRERDGKPAIPVDSFFDLYSGKISPDKYRDKVVLIGASAAGLGNAQPTPVAAMTPVEVMAHATSSFLQQHYFREPAWSPWVTLAAYLLVAGYLIALLPRLSAGVAAGMTAAALIAMIIAHYLLMIGPGIWIKLMLPATLLLAGHLLLTTKRFLMTERAKEVVETQSAVSNRQLAVTLQQQGQMDAAFDAFRKCPFDDELAESLYSLALDFERRRQFNKAENVFGYIEARNAKFRDVADRVKRAKAMSETIILGGSASARGNAATLMLTGSEKPMLGRYQVERELGKGAMGVVYQGKDPKIGRVVAIKTMALAAEFEGDELQEAKDRFFREAETAGQLTHPNIVTIYDAGEEHDLAYIAMEFLKGKDLVDTTKTGQLLPLPRVFSIVARVAEALHYAHAQNVVHRDIKPANIMYERETDVVKVTDFGIARITDASKTKTGMVLGTPSYMSPEQLAGHKIDGRSDLFSLAVTLFQMSCGRLPFEAESMTQLMFKIANEPHPNIAEYNPAVPVWLPKFLDKALAKDANVRFQNGQEFATVLSRLAAQTGASTGQFKAVT